MNKKLLVLFSSIIILLLTSFNTNYLKNSKIKSNLLNTSVHAAQIPRIGLNINDGQVYSSGSAIDIRGWALNPSGVKAADVYVDGKYTKTLACNLSRPDVSNVFPDYPNSQNSGFDYKIILGSGTHSIRVYNIGNDGEVIYAEVEVTVNGSQNDGLQPKIGLNINNGQTYSSGSSVDIRGWALNSSGVRAADVYIDGNYTKTLECNLSRPDVQAAFPQYSNAANSGYDYKIALSAGQHTIRVYDIGNDGNVIYTEVTVTVNASQNANLQPRMGLNINNGQTYSSGSSVDIRGWALNSSGVRAADVYIDGNYTKTLECNLSRPDVQAVFPQYSNAANSGYDYKIALSAGQHTIRVYDIGNDGNVIYTEVTVTVNASQNANLQPRMGLNINNGQTYSSGSSVDIRGWALNSSGVRAADVYIDGNYTKTLECNLSRPDVQAVFPQYSNAANSGYDYKIALSAGQHTIRVYDIGNDGNVIYTEVTVTVNASQNVNLQPRMGLNINDGQLYLSGSTVDIRGWALNTSGVKAADVYIDGQYTKTLESNLARPDVNSAFPDYPNATNSGFDYKITLGDGEHTIRVYDIGNDGNVIYTEASVIVYDPNLQPKIGLNVDDGQVYTNGSSVDIRGWALNSAGVKAADVYIDGQYTKTLSCNLSRPDVQAAFPQYLNAANSGFDYKIVLSSGEHTIRVYDIGNDGRVIYTEASVNVLNPQDTETQYNYSLQQVLNMEMNQSPVEENSNGMWVAASSNDVLKYLDPSSYIDDPYGKYEFLRLTYLSGITANDINGVLQGKGVLQGEGAAFLQAAMDNNINPMYLVAHALLETGNGTSTLATGISVNGTTVYNMFGVHAYDSNANYYGSQYAYNQGWFSVDAAIKGGAKFISQFYINNPNYNQNTLYKMRWNPNDPSHQYATDIKWAINQIYNIKSLIDLCPGVKLIFDIPSFD